MRGTGRGLAETEGDSTPGGDASAFLLEDGTSGLLLEDGAGVLLME